MQYAALMHMRQKKALQSIAQTATRLRMGVKYWLRSKPASSRTTPENNFRTSYQERRKKPFLFERQLNALNCPINRLYRQRGNTHVCPKTPLKGVFGLFVPCCDFCIGNATTTQNRDLPQNYHSADARETRKARKTRSGPETQRAGFCAQRGHEPPERPAK